MIIPQHYFLLHYFNSTTLLLICYYTTFLLYPFIPLRPITFQYNPIQITSHPSILKTPPRSKTLMHQLDCPNVRNIPYHPSPFPNRFPCPPTFLSFPLHLLVKFLPSPSKLPHNYILKRTIHRMHKL